MHLCTYSANETGRTTICTREATETHGYDLMCLEKSPNLAAYKDKNTSWAKS